MNPPRHTQTKVQSFAALLAVALLVSVPVNVLAKGGGGGGGGNAAPAKKAPADVINALLTKYDLNHDGKFEKEELDMMAKLEPDKATQGRAFDVDKNGTLDVAEIAKWREFLKLAK